MRRLLLIGLILLGLILPRLSFAAEQCFPETNTSFCLVDQFNDYWSTNGGLPVFGYPVSDMMSQTDIETQKVYPAQWLERNRFEYHAENAGTPYAVLLGLLGKQALFFQGHEWTGDVREPGPKAGCLWFDETGINVCNQGDELGFKQYWESHGLQIAGLDAYAQSLQLFGQPLTAPQLETNSSGDTVLTQWFERARFEWHPDQPDEFKVLLGRLGHEVFMELEARASDIVYVAWESVAGRWCCAVKLNGILADGSNQHLIDTGFLPTLQGIMAASPHGDRLILRFDKDVIGVMQRDGTYLARLVDLSIINNVTQADWAPDGRSIALGGLYQEGEIFSDRIAVIDPHGNLLWSIDEPAHQVDTPAWSADSQRLAYIRDSSQVMITSSTGATRQVAVAPGQDGFSGPMFWANNDRTLLVQYTEGALKSTSQLYAIDVATGALTPLTSEPDVKSCIRLSPDRQRLAFANSTGSAASAGVEIMRIDGTERQTIDGRLGDWAPDSQHVLVIDDTSNDAFWSVALDGSGRTLIKPAEPSSDREVPGCGSSQVTSTVVWLPNQ